jgi:hypothetical protein
VNAFLVGHEKNACERWARAPCKMTPTRACMYSYFSWYGWAEYWMLTLLFGVGRENTNWNKHGWNVHTQTNPAMSKQTKGRGQATRSNFIKQLWLPKRI